MKQVIEVLSCAQNLRFVDAVAAGTDERALDVSTERLGTILRIVGGTGWTQRREDLLLAKISH